MRQLIVAILFVFSASAFADDRVCELIEDFDDDLDITVVFHLDDDSDAQFRVCCDIDGIVVTDVGSDDVFTYGRGFKLKEVLETHKLESEKTELKVLMYSSCET